jgi:NADP-dependent 3-hydroxy acid dehydrogenase YdfG
VLKNKVAFVTGAGSGIGRALARRWAAKGVKLALNGLDKDTLARTKAECLAVGTISDADVLLLPGDVTVHKNHSRWVGEILDHFGHLDILVSNAGRMICGFVEEVSPEDEEGTVKVNVLAPANLARTVLPHMKQRSSGYIVQLGSVLGSLNNPSTSCYNATKAAVTVGHHTYWHLRKFKFSKSHVSQRSLSCVYSRRLFPRPLHLPWIVGFNHV